MKPNASLRAPVAPPGKDPAMVLGKAVTRAGTYLGLRQHELAAVLGTSPATVSRLARGERGLEPSEKAGELALLVVRVVRSLDALVGGDEAKARAFMEAPHHVLGAAPRVRMLEVEGLVELATYLDAMRGKL